MAETVVAFNQGAPLRLGDVAEIRIGSPPAIGDAIINDQPGLLLIVEKQPAANMLEVTRKVEAALELLKPGLKDVEIDSTIFRPATFIERSIDNLTQALLIGCGLVVVVLIAFLFDWRTAAVSLTAIPLSLIAAVLMIHWWGMTINTMIIAGLVIALGEVVDDAVIDVENIVRRLRLNRLAEHPVSAFSRRSGSLDRSPQCDRLRHGHYCAGLPAGILSGRASGRVLPTVGHRLRAGDSGIAVRGRGGDARAVVADSASWEKLRP